MSATTKTALVANVGCAEGALTGDESVETGHPYTVFRGIRGSIAHAVTSPPHIQVTDKGSHEDRCGRLHLSFDIILYEDAPYCRVRVAPSSYIWDWPKLPSCIHRPSLLSLPLAIELCP